MRVVRFGEDAWLVYTDQPLQLAAAIPGSVPGEDCVLIHDPASLDSVDLRLQPSAAPTVTLPAVWNGEDLAEVRERTGVDVVSDLAGAELTVAFCGFAPGFAYIKGVPRRLHLPRREQPRPLVPAGSIAIAAGYVAVYPTDSPGGWHLLGHCSAELFNPDRDPPALLTPGTRVRFR